MSVLETISNLLESKGGCYIGRVTKLTGVCESEIT